MFMNFPLGLAFGIKMAERGGVTDVGARRRAGIALGAAGFTPVGLVLAKTMIDREVAAETPRGDGGIGIGVGVDDPITRVAAEAVADVVPLLREEIDRALDPGAIADALAFALAGRLASERGEDTRAVAAELAAVLVPVVREAIASASGKQAAAKASAPPAVPPTGKD